MLVELRLDQAERQPRGPDLGHRHLAQEVRQPADVVLVRMGEDNCANLARPLPQIGEVGQHEIDAEMLVARERKPGIDHEASVLVLEHGHVLADLA